MRQEGDARVVSFESPRLDAFVAPELADCLNELRGSAVGRLIVDLGGVAFMDSSAVAALVVAYRNLAPAAELRLAAPSGKSS